MTTSVPPPYQCHDCKSTLVNPRNLVVFIDGTSNKPGDKETNVMKLHNQVKWGREDSELEQRACYLKGIGAYDVEDPPLLERMRKSVYSPLEKAFAWNVEKNVKSAYRWLVGTYQEGDQIYLFGFSRGAYQVRSLASMIHDVGLVRDGNQIDLAYQHYLSINPYDSKTRENTIKFRKDFCWSGVRIHFVGVWDTVSSLGLIKRDVHITSSATVTNACHFRHALALDERRVKFMPEYFAEVNAHRISVRSPRPPVGDVKEVWFPGSHSDVGGTSRPHADVVLHPEDDDHCPVHAGNVPLLWMRREAAANGLVFNPEEFAWDPEDVDLGRKDSMTLKWKIFEILPVRHQVSFSGTGKHETRPHRSRPRLIIPEQHIHSSVLFGCVYTPRATLGDGVDIPTVPRRTLDGLWTTEIRDEEATAHLLSSLLSGQQNTLGSLEKVLFLLLNSRPDNGQTQIVATPKWSIPEQRGFDKFALTVVYDVISNFSISEGLLRDARDSLSAILSSSDQPYPPGAFYVLRFSAAHATLRRRFIAHDEVIKALILTLERNVKSPNENIFPLVIDSLCYLIDDNTQRDDVINQLIARSDGTENGRTRLSVTLEAKAPSQLVAVLKMIASVSFTQHRPDLCDELKPKIFKLAKQSGGLVGSAAVEALVALQVPLTSDIDFSNMLGYLGNTLPRLEVEVGGTAPLANIGDLPPVLRINGSGNLDEEVVRRLVLAIESRDAHERTAATLTLLKLCGNQMIREFCARNGVVQIFMKRLEQKETSLLAAYALKTCLKLGMGASLDFPVAAQLILTMLDRGWFDDVVGRVEGFEIFRELMTFDALRQEVVELDIIPTLVKKLESGERHEVRMSLICLDILERELVPIVNENLTRLRNRDKKIQMKGVKVLSALARTSAGEEAIMPQVIEIMKMILPLPENLSSLPPGPIAALYDLCKNETLRLKIKASPEFTTLQRARRRAE